MLGGKKAVRNRIKENVMNPITGSQAPGTTPTNSLQQGTQAQSAKEMEEELDATIFAAVMEANMFTDMKSKVEEAVDE